MGVWEKILYLKTVVSLRKQAYCQLFNRDSIFAVRVLSDLARFCRAHETTFHPDPRVHGVLEGRREVWLRIQHQLQLSDEDLWKIYGRPEQEKRALEAQ